MNSSIPNTKIPVVFPMYFLLSLTAALPPRRTWYQETLLIVALVQALVYQVYTPTPTSSPSSSLLATLCYFPSTSRRGARRQRLPIRLQYYHSAAPMHHHIIPGNVYR